MTENNTIRVVLYQEGNSWVAQCIEYDIGAQADDIEVLCRRMQAVIRAEREESLRRFGKAFKGIPPSPAHFQAMWDKSIGEFTLTHSPRNVAKPADAANGNVDFRIGRAA